MVVLVGQKLLVTELKHLRVVVIDVVDVLISQVDGLAILLHDELGSLHFSLFVEVWNDEDLIEGGPSYALGVLGEQHLLSSNQLNLVLLIVAVLDTVLGQLKSALGGVFTLVMLHIVLARHLILHDLVDWVGVGREETFLLIEHLGGTGESVGGEASL